MSHFQTLTHAGSFRFFLSVPLAPPHPCCRSAPLLSLSAPELLALAELLHGSTDSLKGLTEKFRAAHGAYSPV